jgi:hypothetical protein
LEYYLAHGTWLPKTVEPKVPTDSVFVASPAAVLFAGLLDGINPIELACTGQIYFPALAYMN